MGKVIGMKTFNSKFKEIEEQRKRELEEYEQQVAEMKKKSEEEKQTRLNEIDDNKSTKIMFGSTQSLIGGGFENKKNHFFFSFMILNFGIPKIF